MRVYTYINKCIHTHVHQGKYVHIPCKHACIHSYTHHKIIYKPEVLKDTQGRGTMKWIDILPIADQFLNNATGNNGPGHS